ncbi:hypothetical protein [Pedobacter miscanthi]|uniref:hypothetical protein n=1 Tax=Pedobacter miscanthi TaxID=2259170 RepID=UPI00292CBA26|nr:hypothetical protein [Pedobacter miscanthi]
MTADKKQQAIKLLKQGLETIQDRAYTEIAEIPTENQEDFQVKYSFVHDGLEGIFTVVGKPASDEGEEPAIRFTLLSEFAADSLHYESAMAKKQVDHDLISAESYLNEHINQD